MHARARTYRALHRQFGKVRTHARTQLINGWTETKQVELGGCISCIRAIHRFYRACRCCTVQACVYARNSVAPVWTPLSHYLGQSGGRKSRGGIALAWIRAPIIRRWKNVNKAAARALSVASSERIIVAPLSMLTLHSTCFNVDGDDRFQRLALLPSIRDDPRRQASEGEKRNRDEVAVKKSTSRCTPSPRNVNFGRGGINLTRSYLRAFEHPRRKTFSGNSRKCTNYPVAR